ncbi:binding-protein-dependent transport systems inner membrane component [Ignisphaera aggregans DSM 17230]|uniref:Binding-protein-dependent transport systems inner membrane component n=1 Tax=Ignisphaera aggregans (strain DSM 17230 / JCM 13409 / AQ1.S1) TaxID=583356 RepID=E0ST02_IGNAA|nr:binding-protein-dependent transport systems inner membrane component [Ignisphaera aggregans DSM 17230]
MSLRIYIVKRALLYLIVFIVANTIIWALIRLAPGDPALMAISRVVMTPGVQLPPEVVRNLTEMYRHRLGLDRPPLEQYLVYWYNLFRGYFGVSTMVGENILGTIIVRLRNDILLLVPVTIVSWFLGNWIGALAARYRRLDKALVPIIYILTSIPYFLMGLLLGYLLGVVNPVFTPTITSTDIEAFLGSPSWTTFTRFINAYTLPFLSMLLVSMGGWASGMRTLMIYEMESNYARYMESLGFSDRRVASYAFRYALNPQISGLGIQLGTMIVAGIVISSVFNYPGAGILLIYAINYRDVFLIQAIAVIYTLMAIAANFLVDLVYALIDPRIRLGVVGV